MAPLLPALPERQNTHRRTAGLGGKTNEPIIRSFFIQGSQAFYCKIPRVIMTDNENKYWAFLSYSPQDNCEQRSDTPTASHLCWGD
jgi:hypothetical protein